MKMEIEFRDVINLIDFLSARMGINTNSYMEGRDDLIADSFEFLEKKNEKR